MDVRKTISGTIGTLASAGHFLDREIYVFGVNAYVEHIINCLYLHDLTPAGIIDNSKDKQGGSIADVKIMPPDSICGKAGNAVILIASQHYPAMAAQLSKWGFSENESIFELFSFDECRRYFEQERAFWAEGRLERELAKIQSGLSCYESLRAERPVDHLIISPTVSIGDTYLWALYLNAYLRQHNIADYTVIIPSAGAQKVIALFTNRYRLINRQDMAALVEYVMFMGEKQANAILVYPRHKSVRCLDVIATSKKWSWCEIYAPFIFGLAANCPQDFPAFITPNNLNSVFDGLGLVKGKTVILAPYANMVEELPPPVWEQVALALKKRGFSVCTNVAGDQAPVNGTLPLRFEIAECVAYLEYAGYFVGIRSGLCDLIGRANCRQIVIFRNRPQLLSTELEFNDLHRNGIAPEARYIIYGERSIAQNVSAIIDAID